MKYVTTATVVALLAGILIGTAYGRKLPLVATVASKLPGAAA